MKIYDCFLYFDEDLLLDLRLNTLNNYVDQFIILEAKEDHIGNKRELKFDIKKFKKFEHKIHYIGIEKINLDKNIKIPKNWNQYHLREQSFRNSIATYIKHTNDDDWIIISDLDEIPNPQSIKKFNSKLKFAVFEQKLFYYKFNLVSPNYNWYGSRICIKKYLKSPQWLRNHKVKKKFLGIFNRGINVIKNGGWHFCNLKSPLEIKKKIESFAHSELNKEEYKNLEHIEDCIEKGIDLFNRNLQFEKILITSDFPSYLYENKDKYDSWIAK